MSLFAKIRGIIGGYLQLDNTNTAHGIAENSDGIEARTNNNAARSNFVSSQASLDDQCTNRLDLKQRDVLIEFSFDGLSGPPIVPPPAGIYGICSSDGGIYLSGQIYVSNGLGVYTAIPMYKMQNVCNVNAFNGIGVNPLSMIENGFYIAELGVHPYNWSLMGDGGGGGGFTAGCDLSGTSTCQVVSAIRGATTPDKSTATQGAYLTANVVNTMQYPARFAYDGTYLWMSDNGSQYVYQLNPATLTVTNKVDLSSFGVYSTDGIAVDGTYLYVSTSYDEHIAIIDKTTLVVVGWAYTQDTAQNIVLDGAGNVYVVVGYNNVAPDGLQKFNIAGCIGQPRNTHTFDAILEPTSNYFTALAFGGGFIWLGTYAADIYKVDPTTFSIVLTGAISGSMTWNAIYAFSYLWMVDSNENTLFKIDPATLTVVSPITFPPFANVQYINDVGIGPDFSFNPNSFLYVSDAGKDQLYAINPVSDSFWGVLSGSPPGSISDSLHGVFGIGTYIWVACNYANPNANVGALRFEPLSYPSQNGAIRDYTSVSLSYLPNSAGGDLSGFYPNPIVRGLQNLPVSSLFPSNGYVLTWNSFLYQWEPQPAGGGGSASGDLSGTYPGPIDVIGLQGYPVSGVAPTVGQFLVWNGAAWQPITFSGGLPIATQAGDIVQWDGSAWQANQPEAGLVNVTLGQALVAGQSIVLELDRTGATQNLLAYAINTENAIYGFDIQNYVKTWRGFSSLFDVYQYDSVALTNRTLAIAWVEGGNTVHVISLTYTFNAVTGTWILNPTLGIDTTIYTGTAITNVSIDYLGSDGSTGQQFVVGFVDTNGVNAIGTLVACTYTNDVTAIAFGASYAIPAITDVYSITVAFDTFNENGSGRYDIAVAYGRSGTNTGFVAWTSVPQGSNTFSGAIFISAATFGSAVVPPKCITIRRMETEDENGVIYHKIGILYGDTVRSAAIMKRPYNNIYEYYYGSIPFTSTAWRSDWDTIGVTIGGYLDGVTVEPGFGDIDESGLFLQLAQATTINFNDRVVVIPGSVREQIPVADRPHLLMPSKTNQWGITSVYVRRLSENKYVWGARETYNPFSAGNDQIFFGIASIRDGRLHTTLGSNPATNTSWTTFQVPSATQKYQKFVPVRMSDNRFVAVFSANSITVGGPACVAIHCICNNREEFFGFMQEAGAVGDTKRCVTVGGISRSHSGLTPGMTYYLERNGLSTRSNGTPVGIAQSVTTMLVVNNKRIQQVNNI